MRREVFESIPFPDTEQEVRKMRRLVALVGGLTHRPLDEQELTQFETTPVLWVEQWSSRVDNFKYKPRGPFAQRYELLVLGRGVAIRPHGGMELFYQLTQTQFVEPVYMKRAGIACSFVHDAREGGLLVYSARVNGSREIRGDIDYDFVVRGVDHARYRIVLTNWMRMIEDFDMR